jgi:hypothetical protein
MTPGPIVYVDFASMWLNIRHKITNPLKGTKSEAAPFNSPISDQGCWKP